MNIFIFCLIFIQVGVFLIAGVALGVTLLTGYGQPINEDQKLPSRNGGYVGIPLTPTELEYFRA